MHPICFMGGKDGSMPEINVKPVKWQPILTGWFDNLLLPAPEGKRLVYRIQIRVQYQESTHCLHLKKEYTFGHYFCDTCWAQTDNAGNWFGGIYAETEPYTSNPYIEEYDVGR